MKEQIRVIVEKDGRVNLQVEGVPGSRCLSITKALEKEMGVVLDRKKTRDFYRSAQVSIKNRIKQS